MQPTATTGFKQKRKRYAGMLAGAAAIVPHASLVDVSMHHVALEAAQAGIEPHSLRLVAGQWFVESESGRFRVLPPRSRAPRGPAAGPGAHNREVLR